MSFKPDISVDVCGKHFKNPVIAASGAYGFGEDYTDLYPLSALGGISCKGTTLNKKDGNIPPRIAETPSGILNSVGLQNPGVDKFINYYLPRLRTQDTVVIANIAGAVIDDYIAVAEKQGGATWGVTCEGAASVTRAVRNATKKPVIVKLTPNVTNITEIAKAVEAEGADSVSLINTLLGMRIDIRTRRPILHNNVGGLSGPAVFPVAVRMVWQVSNAVKIPVIGMGGIATAEDAIEMMMAGASAVQMGTAIFNDPYAPIKVCEGMEKFLTEQKIDKISDIVGTVKPW